jgi:hypothetical protein
VERRFFKVMPMSFLSISRKFVMRAHRACKECARLKSKCDGLRPCARCSRLNKSLHCVDQDSDSTTHSEVPHVQRKVFKACDFCKSKKVKCSGELPCSRCVKRGASQECTYKNGVGGMETQSPTLSPTPQQAILPNFEPVTLDYAYNTMLMLQCVQDMSPLSVFESVSNLADCGIGLKIFFRWSTVMLSPFGASCLFHRIQCLLQDLQDVSPSERLQMTIANIQEITAGESNQSATNEVFSLCSTTGLSLKEQKEVAEHSDAVLRISSSPESSEFELWLNEKGRNLLSFSNEELQRMSNLADSHSQHYTQKSGVLLPPSFFQ